MLLSFQLSAQNYIVTTDHLDGRYAVGETVHFQVSSNVYTNTIYTIRRSHNASILQSGSIQLFPGTTVDIPITGSEPENLVLFINNTALGTAMVGMNEMVPFNDEPADFDAFWDGVKAQLAQVPVNPIVVPKEASVYSKSYYVSLGNIDGRKVYGYLTVPNGTGPFPVLLEMPSYGSAAMSTVYKDFAERANMIHLYISIHNAPLNEVDPFAYEPNNSTNKDLYYHKHSVTAGIRAIDYLMSRPDFNGVDVAVTGVSQGGGLGVLIAGLDSRVNLLAIGMPTMGSHQGLLNNHPSGFPQYLKTALELNDQAAINGIKEASKYYEAAFAAKRFHGPTLLLSCFNDGVTYPETQMVALNNLDGPKIHLLVPRGGHNTRPPEFLNGRRDFFRRHYTDANNAPWPYGGETGIGYDVDAGDDQSIAGGSVPLSAVIKKETAINPNLPVKWRKVSGPGSVSFSNATGYSTNASFSENGTYILEFAGEDHSMFSSKGFFYKLSDRIKIVVGNGGSDDPKPTVALSTPSTNVTGSFVVSAAFSESISGLSASDFVVANGNVTSVTETGSSYQIVVNPISVGSVSIYLPANKVVDAINQGNLPSNMLVVQYDENQNGGVDLALSMTASPTSIALYSVATIVLTLTNEGTETAHNIQTNFKLPNSGYSYSSSSSTAGSFNWWTGVWDVNQLAAGESVTATISANVMNNPPAIYAQVISIQENDTDSQPDNNPGPIPIEDDEAAVTINVGNPNTNVNPSVALSTPSLEISSSFTVNAVFSLSVSGLTLNDFQVENGYVTSLSGSGTNYSVTVIPLTTGLVTIKLPSNSAVDAAGLGNTQSNTLNVEYESLAPSGSYCEPNATPWFEWIKNVTIGSINNSTTKNGYGDFTYLSTDLGQGSSTPISITLGHSYFVYTSHYRVWIDFNKDNDFDDAGEMVLNASLPAGVNGAITPPFNGTIQVPQSAALGQTRMRVAFLRASAPLPCGNSGNGEYEDYTVNITSDTVDPPTGEYCNSSSLPWNEWIQRVQINTINHASSKEGYGDFTVYKTDVLRGQSTTVTITLGHNYTLYNEYYRVWVDANQDGDFSDPGELLFGSFVPAGSPGSNPLPITATLNIPSGATLGETRMRVSVHRSNWGEPCDQGGFGEVEDYTLNIVDEAPSTDYCNSTAIPWNDWIERVQLGSIDNTSFKEQYGNFTDQSTILKKGVPSQIVITMGHGYWIYNEYYQVWIDLNHNGSFESSERLLNVFVPAAGNGTNPPPVFGSITIPTYALDGLTRMRVSMQRNQVVGPCSTSGYGEVEDYTVNIENTSSVANITLNPTFDFSATKSIGGVKAQWVMNNFFNVSSITLERATGDEFVGIKTFEPSGDNFYEYWDGFPELGVNYYRLKIENEDGTLRWSSVVPVLFENNIAIGDVLLYPNLTEGEFHLKVVDFAGLSAKVTISDVRGQKVKVYRYDELAPLLSFYENELTQGMYFVTIHVKGYAPITKRVMLR